MNYDRKFEGPITLRRALEQSRNIPGGARRCWKSARAGRRAMRGASDFRADFQPYLVARAWLSRSHTLDATAAYSRVSESGRADDAVRGHDDRWIARATSSKQNRPQARGNDSGGHGVRHDESAARGCSAWHGRGRGASLNWPLAGKTGTVDDYTDTWFVGFDPNITVGVWVGYDEKKPIGGSSNGETGATAALPIWMDFMRAYIEKRGDRANPPTFDTPRQHCVRDARIRSDRGLHQRHAASDHRLVEQGRSPRTSVVAGSATSGTRDERTASDSAAVDCVRERAVSPAACQWSRQLRRDTPIRITNREEEDTECDWDEQHPVKGQESTSPHRTR